MSGLEKRMQRLATILIAGLAGGAFMCPSASHSIVLAQAATPDGLAKALLDPNAPLDPTGVCVWLFDLVMRRDWPQVAGVLLLVCVYGLLRFAKPRWPWVSTPLGGFAFAEAVAVLGALGTALLGPGTHAVNGALIAFALKAGFVTAGGYAVAKAILKQLAPKWHDWIFPPVPQPVVGSKLGG